MDPLLSVPTLSVVVASLDAAMVGSCVAALVEGSDGIGVEVLVVDASPDASAVEALAAVRRRFPQVRVEREAPGTLVPRLWSAGMRLARGRVVAFTIAQCLPTAGWGRTLVDAVHGDVVGAGGTFALHPGAGPTDRALFYLRYSAFLTPCGDAAEVAADNAAYSRAALERHAGSLAHGFWEVEFHRRARAAGGRLQVVAGAEVHYGARTTLAAAATHRFAHGRHSGAWRVTTGARGRFSALVAAPLVPLVLTGRIARRAFRHGGHRLSFLRALPALLVLASAWALGEAVGALVDVHSPALSKVAA